MSETTVQEIELYSSVAIYRTARKQWTCECPGGSQPCPHDDCAQRIRPGDRYVEYLGEAGAYQSGAHYCLPCGVATWAAARWIESGDSATEATAKTPAEHAPQPVDHAELWFRLGQAILNEALPTPSCITVIGRRADILLQHPSTLTDLHTWAAYIGAGPIEISVYGERPQRGTFARGRLTGWAIEVQLIESIKDLPQTGQQARMAAQS